MVFNVTGVTKALQKLEEKELTIRKLSGFTLDDIIQMLAKGFQIINPTADVEEVRYRQWKEIRNAYGELEGWLCECGRESKIKENYCPNCGAKMGGKTE